MGCRITELVFDCRDPHGLARFWCDVLGWEVVDIDGDEIEIAPSDRVGPTLVFDRSDEPKTQKLRLHIDVRPTDVSYGDELARLRGLGAVDADIGQRDVPWTVLADPEGNEFCLLGRLDAT